MKKKERSLFSRVGWQLDKAYKLLLQPANIVIISMTFYGSAEIFYCAYYLFGLEIFRIISDHLYSFFSYINIIVKLMLDQSTRGYQKSIKFAIIND